MGEVSKVLAVVRDAPSSYLGTGWDTPVNTGFVSKEAPGGRLFMGFSVQDRVDLADRDAVAARGQAHLPASTVVATAGHDWIADLLLKGTWLAVPPGGQRRHVRGARRTGGQAAFAGSDIASEGAGWIEGAIGSGIAAAAHVGSLFD